MPRNKILIVDDLSENIQALRELLRSEDLDVYSAQDANGALELLTQHDFCLALLDVQMPNISGFELAKLIRGVRRFHLLPIIFVTASQEDQDFVFEGYASGAVDLLFKPLNPHAVRAKVKVFVELHERKILLQEQLKELEQLRIAAEAANLAKSQFLANMSHEIRTPLGAVLGFSQLLAKDNFNADKKQEFLSSIKRNGSLLLSLIDDILDLSRIEANKLEFENVEFNILELIEEVKSTLSLKAREKSLNLEFTYRGPEITKHFGDPTRVKQIILNLLGNAIKFTKQGTISTNITIVPGAREDSLTITIRDQGVGLSAAQAERLFKPFAQADSSTRRQFGGSGLGLVISQQLAKHMGGEIRLIDSVPNQGSTFEFTARLPRESEDAAAEFEGQTTMTTEEVASAFNFGNKQILVVDDVDDNLLLMEQYLIPTRAHVHFAKDGYQALEQISKKTFDLILLDIQMPGMDGHEAAERIRALKIRTPIIAVTAHAIRSEKEKILESGCDAVFVKPLNADMLLKKISSVFARP